MDEYGACAGCKPCGMQMGERKSTYNKVFLPVEVQNDRRIAVLIYIPLNWVLASIRMDDEWPGWNVSSKIVIVEIFARLRLDEMMRTEEEKICLRFV